MSRKIILDCDNTMGIPLKEVDDGLTLLFLLGNPQFDLLGITTTFGNGTIVQVYNQTQKLVREIEADIPVFKGDGQTHASESTPAAQFLNKAVNNHPGEITLIATGPLGNIHAASMNDPNFYSKVREIVVMGGYLEPMKLGYRNLAELNFSANPQAAHCVLNAPCPVTVFSGQSCLDAPFGLNDILKIDYWPGKFKWTLIQWLIAFGLYTGRFVFYLWDLLPAVYLSMPELFRFEECRVGSSVKDLQSGMLVEGDSVNDPVIKLANGIKDQQAFYDHLDQVWRNLAERYPLRNW
jgi:inosine-uridine nucleoside N-ribohydrolase